MYKLTYKHVNARRSTITFGFSKYMMDYIWFLVNEKNKFTNQVEYDIISIEKLDFTFSNFWKCFTKVTK